MLEKITSLTNQKIKDTAKLSQKKYREEKNLFLAEGYKTIEAALRFGYEAEDIFIVEDKIEKYNFEQTKIIAVTDEVMKKISTTESSPEIVAVFKIKKYNISDLQNKKRLILLENIKDAGNLGTIIRSANAFGIEGIIFCGDCVDIFNPKVLRSSVGTTFMLPFVKVNTDELKSDFAQFQLVSTTLREKNTFAPKEIKLEEKYIIAFGSEASGITEKLADMSDCFLKIPHDNKVESLNLSVAASIVLYEIFSKN